MSDHTSEDKAGALHPTEIAKLTWEADGVTKTQPVAGEGLTIGRSSQNNLALNDLGASRFHCKILPEAGSLIVVDLDSTNGTYLNGERITGSHNIQDGDELRVGEHVFVIEVFTLILEPEQLKAVKELPLEETYIVPSEEGFPWLFISSGMGKGTVFSLTKSPMEIGRASRNKQWDIDLVDRSVSRPHAELIQKGNQWILEDLESANGTRLNGNDIKEPSALSDGDVIEFGETVMIYRAGKGVN